VCYIKVKLGPIFYIVQLLIREPKEQINPNISCLLLRENKSFVCVSDKTRKCFYFLGEKQKLVSVELKQDQISNLVFEISSHFDFLVIELFDESMKNLLIYQTCRVDTLFFT
jgi:hypothetical protein